jgi:hypothetical protein
MSYRILFVLATGALFIPLSWSDNGPLPDSVPAVFNPQPASVISPPAPPLNDDCSRAIPLESGELVWGSIEGVEDNNEWNNAWYSFTPPFNGTLQITIESEDPNLFIGLMAMESCQDESNSGLSAWGDGQPIVFYREVMGGQSYYIAVVPNSFDIQSFSIQVDLIPPGIPGDLCMEAIEMAPNTSIRCSTVGATSFASNCYWNCDSCRDVWYKFAPSIEGCVQISATVEDDKYLSLDMFESCGGSNFGGTYSFSGHETIFYILDVRPGSDYRLRITQDTASAASFVLENRIVPTVPVFGRIVDKTTGDGFSSVALQFRGDFQYSRQYEWTTTTDSEGYFTLAKDLPEGIYSITADRSEGYELWDLDGEVTLTAGMGPLNLEMVRHANLEVVCIDAETAEPITETMHVSFYPETGRSSHTYHNSYNACRTSPGLYEVASYPKDSTSTYARSEGWVDLKSGENRTCIMSMKKGVPVRGTALKTAGMPDWSCYVRLIGENAKYSISAYDGTFELCAQPGTYGCWAVSSTCASTSYSPWKQITVSEIPEQNADVDLIISDSTELKTIEGTIQNGGSLLHAGPFDVLALPNGIVPSPDNIFTLQELWQNPWSHYSIDSVYVKELPPGNYDVYFGIRSRPKPIFSFTVQEAKLDIPAGTEGLEFVYASEGGTVMGKVLDTEGFPLVVPEVLLNKMPAGDFAGWAKTNPRGQFVFYNVPAGTYTLSAVHRNYTMTQTTVTVPNGPSIVAAETLTMNPKGRQEGADFNGDGLVDLDDLLNLTADWMQEGSHPADLDRSGVVDMPDLARMGQTWLGQAVWLNRPAQFPEYPAGLIGQWTLDEQVDLKTVLDWSGNGRHGRAQQNLSARIQEGMVDLALRFDGTGDYIDCGPLDPQPPAAWTVCAWVKCADTPAPTLLSFGGNYPAVKLQQNGKGRPIVYLGNTNYRYFSASAWTTLKDGLWHHVAFSVPGNDQAAVEQAAMYLDGAAVAESTTMATGPQADKSRLYIGINSKAGRQRFKGAMDEVLLFDRVLAAEEIENIYRSSR